MLVPNWRRILRYAWSIWLILVLILIQALDATMPVIGQALPLPDGWLPYVTIAIAVAAGFARLIPQKGLSDG